MSKQQHDHPLGQDFGWELEQLRSETQARSAEVAAVQLRLRQTSLRPRRSPWLLAPIGVGLAAAAAALVLVLWPPAPETQQLDLVSTEWTSETVHQDVQVHFEGRGQLEATGRQHAIAWREGRLQVSVTPKQDIQLDVTTPEATVSVVGTVFEVHRDLMGTTVSVERGQVSVRCGAGEAHLIVPEDGPTFCQTTSPTGLAALARQRLDDGDLDGALSISAQGLAVAPPDSYATANLHWSRAVIFAQRADWPAALSEAESLLATGQDDFLVSGHQAAARAGREVGGCPVARPHLEWLAESGASSPTERAHLADCLAPEDPEQAIVWLNDAMGDTDDQALKEQLQQRLDQLER